MVTTKDAEGRCAFFGGEWVAALGVFGLVRDESGLEARRLRGLNGEQGEAASTGQDEAEACFQTHKITPSPHVVNCVTYLGRSYARCAPRVTPFGEDHRCNSTRPQNPIYKICRQKLSQGVTVWLWVANS